MAGVGAVKLRPEVLENLVFKRTGVRDPWVLVGPGVGLDFAVVRIGDGYLVAHCDPITGAVEDIGWLAVNIACNDVAVSGARPRWLLLALLFPEDADLGMVDKVTAQVDEAAKELGVMVIGGHTEFAPGLDRPIAFAAAMGYAKRYVTAGGARPGDAVIATKSPGLEGACILARDFEGLLLEKGVPLRVVEEAKRFLRMISVVKEAVLLAEKGYATAMHDPTEGGFIGGLLEVAQASKATIRVYEDKIRVRSEVVEICHALGLDPLRIISSGCLIATVPKPKAREALQALHEAGVEASIIGEVIEGKPRVELVTRTGEARVYEEFVEDELFKFLEEHKPGEA